MQLKDTLSQYPHVPIFGRIEGLESDTNDEDDWFLEPIIAPILRESESSQFFIVKAKNVLPDGTIRDCYIDLFLPERISDCAYFLLADAVEKKYYHECEGEIICAVPIDCFGDYNLFFSKTFPDVGIDILKQGLVASGKNTHIATDLGYILRDVQRFSEAAEMFQISADSQPSSYFTYGELAGCYDEIGEIEKALKYHALFKESL